MTLLRLMLLLSLALTACQSEPEDPEEFLTASPTQQNTGTPTPMSSRSIPAQGTEAVDDRGEADETGSSSVDMTLELGDNFFDPTFIKIDKGATVTISLENKGSAAHTFTIEELDVDEELEGGSKRKIDFKVEGSGVVPFYCKFHNDQGMAGEFRLS